MKAKRQDLKLDRLGRAMQRSRKVLEQYRVRRLRAIRQYVGGNWTSDANDKSVPLNLIEQYVNIFSRNLISRNPQFFLSCWDKAARPTVKIMEGWINAEVERMRLDVSLQRVVLDALFSIGVMKVALASPAAASRSGWRMQAGEPFAEKVDLDDLVLDIHATRWEDMSFVGHRFRVPMDAVVTNQLYSAARKKLVPDPNPLYNVEGDYRVGAIGRTTLAGTDADEYDEMVSLWEIYLPRLRRVILLPDVPENGSAYDTDEPLHEQEWLGPDCGPYHTLMFAEVPGNLMPLAPVPNLLDLHLATNNVLRKAVNQAERLKEVALVQGGALEDGSRVQQANDGDMIRVDDPSSVTTVTYGGPNQMLVGMTGWFKELFSWKAGNMDSVGGLAPSAKTATQDKLLSANSSRTVQDMQNQTVGFTSRVGQALLWYWHHNPFKRMDHLHQVPYGGPSRVLSVTPQQRQQIKLDDLNFSVNPFSLQYTSPEQTVALMGQVMSTVVIPLMPLLQQQGVTVDLSAYLAKVAKFMNIPDLNDIISIAEPPEQGQASGRQPGSIKPPTSQRTYTRENVSQRGNGAAAMQMMSGVPGGGDVKRNGQRRGT